MIELNIAVVDDEKVIREQICRLIKKQKPDCHLEAYAAGTELLASEKRFDIIFLDIQMDGVDGLETARRLRQLQDVFVLIFVTGNREYVFDALDLYAFHYLLKPVEEEKFKEVLERAAEEVQKKQEKRMLFLKKKNLTLDMSHILYIESRGKKVAIHTDGLKGIIEIYLTMEELEGQLDGDFYRCHRGYIVNMAHITEYDNDSITVTNGDQIYLTKKKYGHFVKTYMWYLQNGGISGV
ncbi:MAG: LytTR family DNA-binding domain-containing protein [Bacteroides sp.]|nr:LytTR family DNA-binding domain-containing protein [Bacteroides sp.]